MKITGKTIIKDVATKAEAKEIARSMRLTAAYLEKEYGVGHPTAVQFSDRYFDFVDAMAEKFAA